jgi:hypothetical protein
MHGLRRIDAVIATRWLCLHARDTLDSSRRPFRGVYSSWAPPRRAVVSRFTTSRPEYGIGRPSTVVELRSAWPRVGAWPHWPASALADSDLSDSMRGGSCAGAHRSHVGISRLATERGSRTTQYQRNSKSKLQHDYCVWV